MVVLPPRNPAARRRFGNPNGPYYPPPNNGGEAYHGHHGPPSSPRFLSQQSALLLLAGMGLGYLVATNVGNYPPSRDVGLDVIVKNLEHRRAAAASATGKFDASPMNTMTLQHREAAALLRGDVTANNHRRASSDLDDSVVEGSTDVEIEKPVKKGRSISDIHPAGVKDTHNTFREVESADDEELSAAQKRFVETQKLLSMQSIPTPTNPHVMKTVR
jgi:hypothetical protein